MKTPHKLIALVMLLVVATTGCTTSSSKKIVTLNIKPQPETVVHVMPAAAAQKRLTTSDAAKRALLGILVDQATGIYTYKFDDKDYGHLRQSVVESLQQGHAFRAVHDVTADTVEGDGTRLYISFQESGMQQTKWGNFICILKALAWTEDAGGNVLAKKNVAVEEKSGVTVRVAKGKAISRFVTEVGGLFPSQ